MIGPVRPRRRRLPLTPLIDVIFLLLLFFMLSSTFLRFGAVEVSATGPSRAVSGAQGVTALLKLRHDGSLSLNGAPVAAGALVPALAQLAAGGTGRVLFTAERGASVQALVEALEVLQAGPLPVVLSGGTAAP